MKLKYIIFILSVICLSILYAQILIPIKDQIPIMIKAMNYEMKLKGKIGNSESVNIALIYNETDKLSEKMMKESRKWFKKNDDIKVYGKKIKVFPIAYKNSMDLQKKIVINNIHVIYYCIGLDSHLSEIAEVARSNAMITLSPRWEDIQKGFAVLGVSMVADGYRPYVNFVVAQNYFLEFDVKFLNVAEVIRQ